MISSTVRLICLMNSVRHAPLQARQALAADLKRWCEG
jgi:hypothetical protein